MDNLHIVRFFQNLYVVRSAQLQLEFWEQAKAFVESFRDCIENIA